MDEKEILQNVVKEIENMNCATFDTWGSNERSALFQFLKEEFVNLGYNCFEINGLIYGIYTIGPTSGRGGMDMGSPETIEVFKLNKKGVKL